MPYSPEFRERMVCKMVGPPTIGPVALSREVGVHHTTLWRWLRVAGKVSPMSKQKTPGARRPQDWSAAEKLAAVLETSSLSGEDLGAFLRERGLHEAHLEAWKAQMREGLEEKPRRRKSSPEAKRVRELEREVHRKDKALAEVSALLILKKKAAMIWGDGDDDTPPRSGK